MICTEEERSVFSAGVKWRCVRRDLDGYIPAPILYISSELVYHYALFSNQIHWPLCIHPNTLDLNQWFTRTYIGRVCVNLSKHLLFLRYQMKLKLTKSSYNFHNALRCRPPSEGLSILDGTTKIHMSLDHRPTWKVLICVDELEIRANLIDNEPKTKAQQGIACTVNTTDCLTFLPPVWSFFNHFEW